jgi:hypothetical protein
MDAYEKLASRVDALERQSRRLKRQLFAALVALLCLGTVSATTAQQRAISFSGPKGTLRIDASGVHLLTSRGKEVALFGYTKYATLPAVRFMDSGGTNRLIVGLDNGTNGLVRMFSRHGDKSVDLDGNSTLYFYDDSGTKRFFAGTTTEGTGDMQIYNNSGRLQSEFAPDYIRLGDSGTTERAVIGVTTQNDAVIKLWDRSHTVRNVIGAFDNGTWGFASYDTGGSSTWSSP